MKAIVIIISLLLSTLGISYPLQAQFQKAENENYLWTYTNSDDETKTIGLYGSISGSYSTVFSDPVGYLGARGGVVINEKWGIGLAGYALNYDKALSTLVDDGTYRMQAGYTGLYVEYMMNLTQRSKLSLYILSGEGIVFYEYDKEFREDRNWYEEVIDQETFAVFEPGAEFQYRISQKWWIGAQVSYRTTSPIKLEGADENFLEQVNTGIFFKYGLF